jgi:hypothetical protein
MLPVLQRETHKNPERLDAAIAQIGCSTILWKLPLLSDIAVPVNTATLEDAMMNHVKAEQINGHNKRDEKQEPCNSNPSQDGSFSLRGRH